MKLKDFYSLENTDQEDGKIVTEIRINKNHMIYKGHFPDRPVTPGVILMQLFKEEAERRTNLNLQFQSATNVKFMAVVDPNEDKSLFLHSELSNSVDGKISLKGFASYNGGIALKINALYAVIPAI